ncbi:MAG: V-type ATP synthase subunit D, partial [Oscillospiraceae bacterium]|nr:V-type ATP synthase subunit D [Oscillospiraceae bacterium]
VLIRELMDLNEKAREVQSSLEGVFKEAYAALQSANIGMGIAGVERISHSVPVEDTLSVRARSVMGVEIPSVSYANSTAGTPFFGMGGTTSSLDVAFVKFNAAKDLIVRLAMYENSAYRLAVSIRKTQKRANALKNVTIPRYEALVRGIGETLEERERDEFARLKALKRAR